MMRELECDCQCGPETQKFSERVGGKAAKLSPMTRQCLFHHLIFYLTSKSMCVSICACVCELVLSSIVGIDWAGGNKWGKEIEHSVWCSALQLPLSTIPNH